jgi:hypothetical protein
VLSTYGEAWQAIVMFGLSAIYCAVNLGAWRQIRAWIDIVDKQNWRTFWAYAFIVWVGCLVVLPCLIYLLTKLGLCFSQSSIPAGSLFRACSSALVPLGLSWRTLQFCWEEGAGEKRWAFLGSLPLASFLWAAAAGMIYRNLL